VGDKGCSPGSLEIPIREGDKKAAWIVDGQQRTMALAESNQQAMLVPVTAFVTDDFEIHRAQFLLVNKAKPLPKGLINELLPEVNIKLPPSLAKTTSSLSSSDDIEMTTNPCGSGNESAHSRLVTDHTRCVADATWLRHRQGDTSL